MLPLVIGSLDSLGLGAESSDQNCKQARGPVQTYRTETNPTGHHLQRKPLNQQFAMQLYCQLPSAVPANPWRQSTIEGKGSHEFVNRQSKSGPFASQACPIGTHAKREISVYTKWILGPWWVFPGHQSRPPLFVSRVEIRMPPFTFHLAWTASSDALLGIQISKLSKL